MLVNKEYIIQFDLYILQMFIMFVYNLKCMAKKIFNSITTSVNKTTGDIVEDEKSVTVTTASGDKFFMTFIENMSSFYNISCVTDVKVLAKMCELVEYNTYSIILSPKRRKAIIDDLGINTQTMSNSLNRLKGITLISGDNGEYEINPNIFWKGSTKEREKLLKTKGLEIKIQFRIEDKPSAINSFNK